MLPKRRVKFLKFETLLVLSSLTLFIATGPIHVIGLGRFHFYQCVL